MLQFMMGAVAVPSHRVGPSFNFPPIVRGRGIGTHGLGLVMSRWLIRYQSMLFTALDPNSA
jgi:hypothetical protein